MSSFLGTWADWVLWLLLAVTAVQVAFLAWRARRRQRARREDAHRQAIVRAGGLPGSARVAASRDTRTRIGDTLFFIVELDLEVDATQSTPAMVSTLQVPVSPLRLADFAEGRAIKVRIDPATHEIAVDQPTG